MAELRPILFLELLQLSALNIQPASISFNTLTMESDRYICVRDEVCPSSSYRMHTYICA